MDSEEKQLWQRYERERERAKKRSRVSISLRNQLAERYLGLCKKIAAKYDLRTPNCVDYDDIYSAAYQGLLDGLPRFSLARKTAPSTFLSYRIAGRIRDFLRVTDALTRTQRARLIRVEQWEQTELGRAANAEEVLGHFGFAPANPSTISIDTPVAMDGHRNLRLADVLERQEPSGDLSDAAYLLRGLSQRERLIVMLYHVDGYTMKQIGRELDLSESRVSQLMADILTRMRRNARAA